VRPDDILVAAGLRKTFPGRTRRDPGKVALDGVDLTVPAGRTVGLVGESGSGKSTLARAVLGLLTPDAGTVALEGHDLLRARGPVRRRLQRRVQLVPQLPDASFNPRLRVGDSIAFGLRALPREERRVRVTEVIEAVGLRREFADRYPHQLSGGQAQRLALARALAPRPALIVCDEATSALDKSVQAQVLNLLAELQSATGVALLFVSHDLAVVEHVADEVCVMFRGAIVERGPAARVWRSPEHEYTRRLLAAVPGNGPLTLERQS
jgi:ABC-type glutathione transport system ATPase component